MRTQQDIPEKPVDVVVTWVDGADPSHAARRAAFTGESRDPTALGATRFADCGELRWCLASVVRFAPFVRRIHVITDDQVPPHVETVLKAYPQWRGRIRVVDHRVVFAGYESVLPTFNSLSIETVMHRIPDLAERFLYLNDDFVFASPASEGTYFDADGPILQGQMRRLPTLLASWLKRGSRYVRGRPQTASNRFSQGLGARLAGRVLTHLYCDHHPHALRRSTLDTYFERHPGVLERQIAHRFRSNRQFVPVALANNIELSNGRPSAVAPKVGYLHPPSRRERSRWKRSGGPPSISELLDAMEDGQLGTMCLQSLDELPDAQLAEVHARMDRHLGLATVPDAVTGT